MGELYRKGRRGEKRERNGEKKRGDGGKLADLMQNTIGLVSNAEERQEVCT